MAILVVFVAVDYLLAFGNVLLETRVLNDSCLIFTYEISS